jgi:hypothetical protein
MPGAQGGALEQVIARHVKHALALPAEQEARHILGHDGDAGDRNPFFALGRHAGLPSRVGGAGHFPGGGPKVSSTKSNIIQYAITTTVTAPTLRSHTIWVASSSLVCLLRG